MIFVPYGLITMPCANIADGTWCSSIFLCDSGQWLSARLSDMGVSVSEFLNELRSDFLWSVPWFILQNPVLLSVRKDFLLLKGDTSSRFCFWQSWPQQRHWVLVIFGKVVCWQKVAPALTSPVVSIQSSFQQYKGHSHLCLYCSFACLVHG